MRSNAHINRVRSLRLVKKAWDGFMKIGSNNASYQGTGRQWKNIPIFTNKRIHLNLRNILVQLVRHGRVERVLLLRC